MTESQHILRSIEELKKDFKAFNDVILPAIEKVFDDKLKPYIEKQTSLERRLTDLELIVHKHIKETT